jgi:hypothetical protein
VFKSPENKNHADKNYYQIKQIKFKEFCMFEINFIKICIDSFKKKKKKLNVVLYEIQMYKKCK